MTTKENTHFAEEMKLPLPHKFGSPSMGEDWSWNVLTLTSACLTKQNTLISDAEGSDRPLLHIDFTISLDTGDIDHRAILQAVNFSRKLHYLLTTGSARLVVRQNEGANGFETWQMMNEQTALLDATRHVSLLTQLREIELNPATFSKTGPRGRQSS